MSVAMAKKSYFNDPSCGDQYANWEIEEKSILCIVDGLGHGPDAETAAKAAVAYVGDHLSDSLSEIFKGCDAALRSTRGAVMGIAVIDENAKTLTYAGIGNTEIRIIGRKGGGLASDRGIVGGGYRSLNPQTLPLADGQTVLMFTDGIDRGIDISGYDASLVSNLPDLAKKIIEDWGQETDDRAVLIYRSGGCQGLRGTSERPGVNDE